MTKVYLRKADNNYIKVETEEEVVYKKLWKRFSFEAPGKDFNPSYKARFWDGYIRLFSQKTGKIYAGLLLDLVGFGKDQGWDIRIDKALVHSFLRDVDETVVDKWLSGLNLSAHGKEITTRDFQNDLIKKVICGKRLAGLSATSSGKSLVIYCLVRWFLEMSDDFDEAEDEILIVVPSTILVDQMYSDFEDYSSLNGWDVGSKVAKIYAGREKDVGVPVRISTWQSLFKESPEYFDRVRFVLVDECHKAKADGIRKLVEMCLNAEYRVGLTGTLDSVECNEMIITGLFGRVVRVISTKDLIERGDAAKPDIHMDILVHPEPEETGTKMTYPDEVSYFRNSDLLHRHISELVGGLQGNTMILAVNVDEFIVPLSETLMRDFPDKRILVIHGSVKQGERSEIRKIMEENDDCVLVCSYETVGTGFSVRNIQNMIFAQSYKSIIKIVQAIGRGIRLKEGKNSVIIHDLINVFENNPNTYSYEHGIARMKIYKGEGHQFKIKRIFLNENR